MKSRILHSSYVIDFLDVNFNADEISRILKLETDEKLECIKEDKLKDWEVQFKVIYGKGSSIRVYRKMPSYLKDKQKQITIHIPVPTKDIVEWGVDHSKYIDIGKNPNEDKNVSFLNVNFKDFTNRTNYIVDCLRRVIDFCIEDGFTINGVKVKG